MRFDWRPSNWRLDIRQAAFVQSDEHADDLSVLGAWFAEWLGSGRLFAGELVIEVYAETEQEAHRFEAAAKAEIAERDLFLVTALHRRERPGAPWTKVASPDPPPSDEEIEAELARFLDGGREDG